MGEAEPDAKLAAEIKSVIREFEDFGAASFQIPDEADLYDGLMDYLRKYNAYTFTTVDNERRTVTVSKRAFGTMELG